MMNKCPLLALLILFGFVIVNVQSAPRPKRLRFGDPNTGYLYTVSGNETNIKVYRQVDDVTENIQRINFKGSLVDFDLHCERSHCYMVVVTNRIRRNVELYSWQRTQFDLLVKRDSFARPHGVKLFSIRGRGFYIAVAQDQLHLAQFNSSPDIEEPKGFIGCAVLKFSRGHEKDIKYHQYIKLPYTPHYVSVFTSANSNSNSNSNSNNNNTAVNTIARPTENYHLVFSNDSNWISAPSQQSLFIWSPLNDYFWPYRIPANAEIVRRPGTTKLVVRYPTEPSSQNLTKPQEYVPPVEACFHQLQRLLSDRDYQARELIKLSPTIWRFDPTQTLTNISSQVIVHGNVTVRGSMIESPQISLFGHHQQPVFSYQNLSTGGMRYLSPAAVENKMRRAKIKLEYMREKLSHAVLSNNARSISSQIRFFATLYADEVIFGGVANSNVQLNGIPFYQLERELVSLNGAQNIGSRVEFGGQVSADVLEIHGKINGRYWLKDAIDISSKRVQVIDITGHPPNVAPLDFYSIRTPEVILTHLAAVNTIPLSDFITRDNRTQLVFGKKTFKHVTTGQLELAHAGVQLNGLNITHIAMDAIHLREPPIGGRPQHFINGAHHVTFLKSVRVNRLTFRNRINQHINMTSLIQDSVKTYDDTTQYISGHKNFMKGLKVNRLTTDGSINGIHMSQVFNLNDNPPLPDLGHYMNASSSRPDMPITGNFAFSGRGTVHGNVNAALVNGVDLNRRIIRRTPYKMNSSEPQMVRGRKTFYRPLRVLDQIKLIEPNQVAMFFGNNSPSTVNYPTVNGIDLRQITSGLERQMQRPPTIHVDNLEIDGNLNLPIGSNYTSQPATLVTFGNHSVCPLNALRSNLILAGPEDQMIDAPVRIRILRSRRVSLDQGGLNGLSFPGDFILRSSPQQSGSAAYGQPTIEPVFGHKSFDHVIVSPSSHQLYNGPPVSGANNPGRIFIDRGASINQVAYGQMQDFVSHERQRNSTGEKVFNTINVYGNIRAKRINGYYWPDDILLRSASSRATGGIGPYNLAHHHKRIYSPLVFTNSSHLEIVNQLVLRGPIQLHGRMNGVNLTEFARQSATYGDKDLMSIGRPIRNKVFLGGITVRGELRSQGYIDGVNIDEMRNRAVTIGPQSKRIQITAPKMFLSDTLFSSPVRMNYLNDLPLDNYLRSIRFEPDGLTIRIPTKKSVTGALRVRDLVVRGLINRIDFADLQARAISLSPSQEELKFNKTLTIEGDVFMDNLFIDEKNGTLDGVRLSNLIPIGTIGESELILRNPIVTPNVVNGAQSIKIGGSIQECQITCNLQPLSTQHLIRPPQPQPVQYQPQQQVVGYPPRPIYHGGRNVSMMRTPPPYVISTIFTQPPPPPQMAPTPLPLISHARGMSASLPAPLPPSLPQPMQTFPLRRPMSILYEQRMPSKKLMPIQKTPAISESLNGLRQQMVSLNLVGQNHRNNLVIGFIQSLNNDIGSLVMPDQDYNPVGEFHPKPASFMILDQVDIQSGAVTRHLSVGIDTSRSGQNVTSVLSTLGLGPSQHLSILPVDSPNCAKFIRIGESTFLLISQDYTVGTWKDPRCPVPPKNDLLLRDTYDHTGSSAGSIDGGIHVYLFHQFQTSSSLYSAYFDLFQTIDLPFIDNFEKFTYKGSWYVLAVSRLRARIYLMIMRGYLGFQVVSHIDAPMIDYVTVYKMVDERPALIIHQTDGLHRMVESVII